MGEKEANQLGSLGAGFSLQKGVKTTVNIRSKTKHDITNYGIRIKGFNTGDIRVSEYVLNKFLVDEKYFDVTIITQNVDNLHERAGSTKVIHLHGELIKARSSGNPSLIYDIDNNKIEIGDLCDEGHQLRPHIVWFGEEVPMMTSVIPFFQVAEIVIVIGTSLSVYPASGLIDYASAAYCYYIDPNGSKSIANKNFKIIPLNAAKGVKELVEELKNKSMNS